MDVNIENMEVGGIMVTPWSPTIGAQVQGVDLSSDLSDDEVSVIRRALLAWKVLFFRDQDITTEQHLAFARRFGKLEVHPVAQIKVVYPAVLGLNRDADSPGFENMWHSDGTWRTEPALGTVLRMIEGPAIGGDTLFVDMQAAYDGLPQRIKDRVDGRIASHHQFRAFYQRNPLRKYGVTEEQIEEDIATPVEHPVIRTHPETGRKGIYVNPLYTHEIVGMNTDESHELLNVLYRQATVPEYQVRFRWAPHSIAFWDNRSCQHYAVSDYWPHVRRHERVTIAGDTPYYNPDQAPPPDPEPPFRGHLQLWSES